MRRTDHQVELEDAEEQPNEENDARGTTVGSGEPSETRLDPTDRSQKRANPCGRSQPC